MALLIIFHSPLSFGQIYKWVDEKGKIHFGDQPPSSDTYQSIRAEKPATNISTPSPALSTKDLLRGYTQRRQQKEQQQEADKQRQAAMKERCAKLQGRIQYYDGYRHRRTDSNGTSHYLNDAEIRQEKLRIEADIRKYCR